jgi:stage II sporulation protein E
MMNAGCDETSSIETVNSVLVLCEAEEAFSTIDIFLFDLDKGIAEFVKAGASPSYIKSEEDITKVSFESMPVGILDYVNVRKGLKSIKSGDCVYMMSDGFFRAFGDADDYIRERLEAYEGRNPQRIAEGLLEEARCGTEGQAPDDITVIALKYAMRGSVS